MFAPVRILLGAVGCIVLDAAAVTQGPGLRVTSVARTSNGSEVVWVARGAGSTNELVQFSLPSGGSTNVLHSVVPAGGVAPWYDVTVTSLVPVSISGSFLRVLGPKIGPPQAIPQLAGSPDQQTPAWVGWSDVSSNGAAIHQFQASPVADFSAAVMETWPMGNGESIAVLGSTDLFCRVRAWSYYPEAGGVAGAWSSARVQRVMLNNPPQGLRVPGLTTQRAFSVSWSAPSLTTIHQVQYSPSDAFTGDVAETWPLGTQEIAQVAQNGVSYFRVRAWSHMPESGGVASAWSAVAACTSAVQLAAPVFTNLPPAVTGTFSVGWTPVGGAAIYELQLRATNGVLQRSFWPLQPVEPGIPAGTATVAVVRVRAWTKLPELGGEDGVWSESRLLQVFP